MKLNMLATVMACVLAWAMFVTALPATGGDVPGISLRNDFTLDQELLGINCRGSSECRGICHPNMGNIKYFVDQIDDDSEYGNGHQIACHYCDQAEKNWRGICVYAQNLKFGETVKGKVVKASVNALISHGCKKCGSNPIHPGNNVNSGQITVNFVEFFCATGVCPPWKKRRAEVALDSVLDGANCDGNFGCEGGYCPPNITSIKTIVDQIDDNKLFSDTGMIACHRCATEKERPADFRQGICVFAKNLKGSKTVTGKVVKDSVNNLMKHGCKRCGGIPVSPTGDTSEGLIKIDFTRGACETGLCGQRAIDAQGEIYEPANADADAGSEEIGPRDNSIVPWSSSEGAAAFASSVIREPLDYASSTRPLHADPTAADTLLGINCRGSGHCNKACRRDIFQLADYIYKINDTNEYGSGEQIACVVCKGQDHGFCAFAQYQGDYKITGATVKEKLKEIVAHGCKGCGSAPLYPGNDVSKGQFTVNYSDYTCGEGICKPN